MLRLILLAATAIALSFIANATQRGSQPTTRLNAQAEEPFNQWKAELVADLKQNWLPLAGLFWLKPGDNSFGTASSNDIVFPRGPVRAGVFTLQGERVILKLTADAHAVIGGKPLTQSMMEPDISGNPTVVEVGSLQFHVIKRGQRVGIRLKDLESEAVKKYQGPIFFPDNPVYRVTAKWVVSDGKHSVNVPDVLGDVTQTPILGRVEFTVNGRRLQLLPVGGDPTKSLFFVFNDLTSRTETYPAGRFLDSGPVVSDRVLIDFNRAYNPPCAVTPYATCPLPPAENRLSVAIPAGERYERGQEGH